MEVGVTPKNNLSKTFTKNGSKCNDYLQLKEATVLVSQVIAKRKEDCLSYFHLIAAHILLPFMAQMSKIGI